MARKPLCPFCGVGEVVDDRCTKCNTAIPPVHRQRRRDDVDRRRDVEREQQHYEGRDDAPPRLQRDDED